MDKALPGLAYLSRHEDDQDETYVSDAAISVSIVGGKRIIRTAIEQLLRDRNFKVCDCWDDQSEMADTLMASSMADCGVILIIAGEEPFGFLSEVRGAIDNARPHAPMAVLGASANRGQVYAALRMGAKGYVSLDARPDELAKALTMVASNKTYLSSDAAELVTSDISEAVGDSSTRNLLKVALSKREIEIVQLLCDGLSNKEIGGRLHISHKTVENHRHNIYCACGVDGLPGLMRYAIQAGIITL